MFIYNFRWFTHERKERPSSSKEDLSQPPPKIFFGTFWCFFTFKLLFLCLVGQYLLLYYYYTTAYNFVLKIYIILLSNITKYYYYNTYNYQFNNTSVQMKKKVDTIQTYKFWVLDMKWNVKKHLKKWTHPHITSQIITPQQKMCKNEVWTVKQMNICSKFFSIFRWSYKYIY